MSATIHSAYNLAESIGFSDKLSRYSLDTIIFYVDSDLAILIPFLEETTYAC
jgi:hypothetical protein